MFLIFLLNLSFFLIFLFSSLEAIFQFQDHNSLKIIKIGETLGYLIYYYFFVIFIIKFFPKDPLKYLVFFLFQGKHQVLFHLDVIFFLSLCLSDLYFYTCFSFQYQDLLGLIYFYLNLKMNFHYQKHLLLYLEYKLYFSVLKIFLPF